MLWALPALVGLHSMWFLARLDENRDVYQCPAHYDNHATLLKHAQQLVVASSFCVTPPSSTLCCKQKGALGHAAGLLWG